MMVPYLRIIGDVHGKYGKYIALAQEAEYSIQLGDLGFDYGSVRAELDPVRHRVLAGNHDNYEEDAEGNFVWQPLHFLGDFGILTIPEVADFFFIRGGYSIDRMYRDEGVDWWPKEQISYATGKRALQVYGETKPDHVISHECPAGIIPHVSPGKTWDGAYIRPSMTAQLLDQMWEVHQPKSWHFGHHHNDWAAEVKGTKFCCLAELSYLDMPKERLNDV